MDFPAMKCRENVQIVILKARKLLSSTIHERFRSRSKNYFELSFGGIFVLFISNKQEIKRKKSNNSKKDLNKHKY